MRIEMKFQSELSSKNARRSLLAVALCLMAGHNGSAQSMLAQGTASAEPFAQPEYFAQSDAVSETAIFNLDAEASAGGSAIGSAADDALYADGARAIHESRWADADAIFAKVAQQRGEHVEGALYWQAYAENKLGQPARALATCAELKKGFPASRWLDECGALEIEIRSNSGQPVEPKSESGQDLKILALNALMHKDEPRAIEEIRALIESDQPETQKEHALFVLAQSSSQPARQLLQQVAQNTSNPALQSRASQLLSSAGASAHSSFVVALDAVVNDADGKPVSGLTAQDFTVLDDGKPLKIATFHQINELASGTYAKPDTAMEVMILFDTVNASVEDVGYERQQVADFLRANGGRLAQPVTLIFFNGKGAVKVGPASRDGNALAAALEKADANRRPIRRSEAFYGAVERLQLSLDTLGSLITENAHKPGRKMLIWISPGWPLLPGTDSWTDDKQTRTLFQEIVAMSTGLRLSRMVLYSIDPVRNPGSDSLRWFRYKEYVKGVSSPKKALAGNLSLEVLAEQSGGQALNYTTDYMSGEIAKAISGASADYFLSFAAPAAAHKDEYHSLKITVDRPGAVVHTRTGYYNQP
jgi:VWFA-related protein